MIALEPFRRSASGWNKLPFRLLWGPICKLRSFRGFGAAIEEVGNAAGSGFDDKLRRLVLEVECVCVCLPYSTLLACPLIIESLS